MGEIKLKVREMRGNMWQKQKDDEEDAIATTAAEDEMKKRQKLLRARSRLQAAQNPDVVAGPLLMLGDEEQDSQAEQDLDEEHNEKQWHAVSNSLPVSPAAASPDTRRGQDEWYTLQPVPPSKDNPDGCPHPQGQISVICTATFKSRGPNYVTLETRRRRSEVEQMTQVEHHEMLARFFLKWRLTWRPAPPQTPELDRRRRRLYEDRQALEEEFDRFVNLTESRASLPLAVASSNNHLRAHTEALRRQREEARMKDEEVAQQAADAARERRLKLTGGLLG